MRFAAIVAALALAVGNVNAAPFETLGGPNGGGSNLGSSLGLNISLLGLVNINIAPSAITGTADASVSLDGSDTGTVQVNSTALTLADTAGSAVTALGTVNYALTGVGINASVGPVAATTGNFVIDNTTAGSLVLNTGIINLNGNLLIVGAINENIDLSLNPISVNFASLPGGVTLLGTTDDDLTGNDTTAPGEEINIAWNGASITTDLDVSGNIIPITITLTGAGISIGQVVPEANTMILVGMAVAGAGAAAFRRRRSA